MKDSGRSSPRVTMSELPADVSLIVPVHNAALWLDECLTSVFQQDFGGALEVSLYNDGSTDDSALIIQRWKPKLEERGMGVIVGGHDSERPLGVGCAKNQAIRQSCGRYLCFLDSDDVMMPQRVRLQYEAAQRSPDSVFTSHGPTVIMPTWFCSREWFCHVGQFVEDGQGTPEDLLFFYDHLRKGGGVHRLDECLLQYRYHEHAATHSVSEETIWKNRVQFLEERVLDHWSSFTIWNAGKQGRKLYRSLTPRIRDKVVAFCDVDGKKISKGFYTFEESEKRPKPRIPVLHFTEAKPPFIICVKLVRHSEKRAQPLTTART